MTNRVYLICLLSICLQLLKPGPYIHWEGQLGVASNPLALIHINYPELNVNNVYKHLLRRCPRRIENASLSLCRFIFFCFMKFSMHWIGCGFTCSPFVTSFSKYCVRVCEKASYQGSKVNNNKLQCRLGFRVRV